MSSYVNFYVKNPINGSFTPLASYSRNSLLYRVFDDNMFSGRQVKDENGNSYTLPVAATKTRLKQIQSSISSDIQENESIIVNKKEKIDFIMDANNSLDEKMEIVDNILDFIDELTEDNREAQSAIEFIGFLIGIIEQFEYTDNYLNAKDEIIYIGIDCYIHGLHDKLYGSQF